MASISTAFNFSEQMFWLDSTYMDVSILDVQDDCHSSQELNKKQSCAAHARGPQAEVPLYLARR